MKLKQKEVKMLTIEEIVTKALQEKNVAPEKIAEIIKELSAMPKRSTRGGKGVNGCTANARLCAEYWDYFEKYCYEQKTRLKVHQPTRAQYDLIIPTGISKITVRLSFSTKLNRLGCVIYIDGEEAKDIFQGFLEHKIEIEKELGLELEWQLLSHRKASRINFYRTLDYDITDKSTWLQSAQWCLEYAELFHRVFDKWSNKLFR
ncbi:MAG: DUF4268 domain-containing protein [Campylobacteraceae bacterium]|nr:DUF4268 domain-containing protein [Campylobacteraceae bacterium]